MAKRVSLMVLPNTLADAPPQLLLDQNGIWLDMMPDDQGNNAVNIQETKKEIDSYFQKIMAEVELQPAHTADNATLKATFATYYRKLVTTKVREALFNVAQGAAANNEIPELLVHTHTLLEWIPWEMFHDGRDFLGLRFRIARLPIMRQIPDVSAKDVAVQRVYNLLANNFLDAAQQTAWENTFNGILPAGHETTFPPPFPSVDNIVNARDADILHITCHGGLRDPASDKEVYWTLDSQNMQSLNYELRTNLFDMVGYDTKPLVFGNACASTDAGGGNSRKNGLLPGYGASFFARGALNFVGTFAPITKSLAVEFARLFYQYLLGANGQQPLPIAQALWETKNHYRQTVKSPDPSYLFYCLYGPPDTVFHP